MKEGLIRDSLAFTRLDDGIASRKRRTESLACSIFVILTL